jgi:phytoene dehydrogenase-like protein
MPIVGRSGVGNNYDVVVVGGGHNGLVAGVAGVTGIPGRHAVTQVLRDLRRARLRSRFGRR